MGEALWRLITTKRLDDDTAFAKAACFMIAQAMVDLRNLRRLPK